MGMKTRIHVTAMMTIFLLTTLLSPTWASEGGGSHYVQGMNGDFCMGLVGPKGFYIRNDLAYLEGTIGPVTRGRFTLDSFEQKVWVNTFKFMYIAEAEVFSARPGVALAIPVVINADASGEVISPSTFSARGDESGISDPALVGFLNWKVGKANHVSIGMSVYSPMGKYDVDEVINLGRNYWSFDPYVAYTWLHPERGHEISVNAGVMFNTENNDTDYQTGDEFHVDATIAQHFSPTVAMGLVGYYYEQLSNDEGVLVGTLPVGSKGFRGKGIGVGPALMWRPTLGGKDVTLSCKWIHDVKSERRLDSDVVMLSAAFMF